MKAPITYLNFDGNCREAMQFYERCFGGELFLMKFSEGGANVPPESQDRIMHSRLSFGAAQLMASDTVPGQGLPYRQGTNYWIMVPCESANEIDRIFSALSDKGQATMPLQSTFWAARFGILTDQFGINWMLNFEKA